MENLEELCNKARESINKDVQVNDAKLALIPIVAGVMQKCLDKLVDQMPDKGQIDVSGWWYSGDEPTVNGSVRLYYDDQKNMKDSAEVLEALDEIASIELWRNYDLPATLTRSFQNEYLVEGEEGVTVAINIYWAVTEGIPGGCTRRLVRIDRATDTRETPVYELVCPEPEAA